MVQAKYITDNSTTENKIELQFDPIIRQMILYGYFEFISNFNINPDFYLIYNDFAKIVTCFNYTEEEAFTICK